jgi:hypothetical protein
MKNNLLKNSLLVIFLFAAGTVFSQTRPGADPPPQGTPNSEEHADDTKTLTEPDSGETSKAGPDEEKDKNTEIIPPAVPVKPGAITTEKTSPEGPPQWAKDLRRGEIIAFGSLPFTFFFTQTFMDLYRTATHDWDNRYAPSVFKGAGAIPMTDTELKMMFGIALSSSVLVAVVDHFIVKHKRNKARASQQ